LAIVNNGDVHNDIYDLKFLNNDIWGKNLLEHDSHRSYRPLLIKTFQFIVFVTNGKIACYFRIISIAFHSINSNLVMDLAHEIFDNFHISLAAAVMFASHPIHVEAVTAVVNLSETMSCCFLLLSYLLFFIHLKKYGENNIFLNILIPISNIICSIISIFYKETGLIICFIIISNILLDFVCDKLNLFYFNFKLSFFTVEVNDNDTTIINNNKENKKYKTKNTTGYLSLLWITISLIIFILYFLMRNILLLENKSNVTFKDLIALVINLILDPLKMLSNTYLGNSLLIRKAENPFVFLNGREKTLSYMVFVFYIDIYIL
jgi:hypothetical protein